MILPLRDRTHSPLRRLPIVSVLLIIVNVAIYVFFEYPRSDEELWTFIMTYGSVPARFFGSGEFTVATILPVFSSMYLHGGWWHLISNMIILWIFGHGVEDRMGHVTFFFFYTFAGVASDLVQGAIHMDSVIPSIGASGAIAAVMGAYMLLFPDAKVLMLFFVFVREISAFTFCIFWFVMQLANGMLVLDPLMANVGGVGWWAHIGGFVAGMLLAYPLGAPDS